MKNLKNAIIMKNFLQLQVLCKSKIKNLLLLIGLFGLSSTTKIYAQIPPNAVNADPAARAITQVPLGSMIVGNGVIKFRFTNEATSTNNTGQIPAGSVRLTISFPGNYAFNSANDIPKFAVEDAETTAYGTVHLVNNSLILEGEVLDLLLNVRTVIAGSGAVTFNADRVTPITVANLLTSNDNSTATFSTTAVLPVSITEFTARKQNCTANLSWKTSNEINISNYVVEMSDDRGASYRNIGTVAATNTAVEKTYNTSYQMTGSNAYLYRIRINELSGSYSYSPVARINTGCGKGNEISVYPSPAISNITLSVSDDAFINTKATIIDVSGKTHMSFIINANSKNIDVSKLPAGMYVIRLDDGSNARFMKQ
jgi:hypothetical protein